MKRLILFALLALPAGLPAADFYENLQVADRLFHKVYVLSSNASSLSIRHSQGISQVSLADLDSGLQEKYGYDPQVDAERARQLRAARREQREQAASRLERQIRSAEGERARGDAPLGLKAAFASFGQQPRLEPELDLRAAFRSHGIGVRRQRGPSCSVHAIAAALEFQYAEKRQVRVDISENHLVAATSRVLGRAPLNELLPDRGQVLVTRDEGFALEHVFQAIRGYGLRLEANKDGRSQEPFETEFSDVVFSPFQIPGGTGAARIGNIIHVLNARMPVVVGMSWPADEHVRHTSLLSKQAPAPGAGHAVTLVGYRCPSGRIEDTKFIFRNSWGADWGAGGYGFLSYEFLSNNLFSCYVVELR